MDYDVVRTCAKGAYRNFNYNDAKFYKSMDKFYENGKENPSVAKIIMNDEVNRNRFEASKRLAEVAAIPTSSSFETHLSYETRGLSNIAAAILLKPVEAEDLYNNTTFIKGDYETLGFVQRKEFDDSWKEKYPRTGALRERIIKANRIAIDEVTPKADWMEKISYARTLDEYQEMYPKTCSARYSLLNNNQINDEGVSSRIKGRLKRFYYKMLIKGKFGFRK